MFYRLTTPLPPSSISPHLFLPPLVHCHTRTSPESKREKKQQTDLEMNVSIVGTLPMNKPQHTPQSKQMPPNATATSNCNFSDATNCNTRTSRSSRNSNCRKNNICSSCIERTAAINNRTYCGVVSTLHLIVLGEGGKNVAKILAKICAKILAKNLGENLGQKPVRKSARKSARKFCDFFPPQRNNDIFFNKNSHRFSPGWGTRSGMGLGRRVGIGLGDGIADRVGGRVGGEGLGEGLG